MLVGNSDQYTQHLDKPGQKKSTGNKLNYVLMCIAALSVSLLVVQQVSSSSSQSVSGASPFGDEAECPATADHWMLMATETGVVEKATDLFEFSPDLHLHRNIAAYTDDDVDTLFAEAVDYFKTQFGVDFTEAEAEESTGIRLSADGGFQLWPIKLNWIPTLITTTEGGPDPSCPSPMYSEVIMLVPIKVGVTFHGIYGGDEGRLALAGEVVNYGHVFMEYDKEYVPFKYQVEVPLRLLFENFESGNRARITHPQWGPGIMNSYLYIYEAEGGFKISVRSSANFPEHY